MVSKTHVKVNIISEHSHRESSFDHITDFYRMYLIRIFLVRAYGKQGLITSDL